MKYQKILTAALLIFIMGQSYSIMALEVDREVVPQILLGGRMMSTVDAGLSSTNNQKSGAININDSSLLIGFDKRLYRGGIGSADLGITETHDGPQIHHLSTHYRSKYFRLGAGKGRLINSLIEFPTARDDDLLTYTHALNASSNEEFDQVYGKNLSLDWFVDGKLQAIKLWASTRHNQKSIPGAGEFDSFGLGYAYEQSEDRIYVKQVRHLGLLLEQQKVLQDNKVKWNTTITAGLDLNLNINPEASWSVQLQGIYNQGTGNVSDVKSYSDQATSAYHSGVVSFRHTGRPLLLTRWQSAFTFAYKNHPDIVDAQRWTFSPSLIVKLGQGIDLIGQFGYHKMGPAFGEDTQMTAQIGLAFNLDTAFNESIGGRSSILNLEHGYME